MAQLYSFFNDNVSAGQTSILNIRNEASLFGMGVSNDISVGIITSSSLGTGIITATSVSASSSITAPEFHGSFIGTVAGTASTSSFATTAFALEGNPDISVGVVTATGGFISTASTTPIQINFDSGTNSITFSIAGIGTTSLVLF